MVQVGHGDLYGVKVLLILLIVVKVLLILLIVVKVLLI
jgi:hypothetical protein